MSVLPGDPPVELTRVRTHRADGYEVTRICLGSHTGTHLDAPRHFFPEGRTLDEFPPERFVGPGVVVDCRVPAGSPAGARIGAELLSARLRPWQVPAAGFVLLRTEGALLAESGARLLLEAGAGIVGTDGFSLDDEPFPVHRLLLGGDVLILENLDGLDRLRPGPVTCACLPLALMGVDGAPARMVVWR